MRVGHGGYELVTPDRRRVPLVGNVTVGRAPSCTVQIDEPSVSRVHARILAAIDPPVFEDMGSRNGSFVNGVAVQGCVALTDGAVLGLGDCTLRIERAQAGEGDGTVIGPIAGDGSERCGPRLRSGVVIRRAGGGSATSMLVAPDGREVVRVDESVVALVRRLDGTRTTAALVREVERSQGGFGVGRLVHLIALLADHGMIDGAACRTTVSPAGRLRRLLRSREWVFPGAGRMIDAIYRRAGFALFTTVGLAIATTIALAGAGAFAIMLAVHGRTPLVVGSGVAMGAAVFLAGRLLGVALHELAHGLALASFGHAVPRAGVKLIVGLPFGFVDTSPAWLEPRRRRLAISAAGPACDLVVGGALSLIGALAGPGLLADLALQLALAAYVGAVVNLNPLLERDGHHMLEDLVGEPALRRRAQDHLARRMAGTRRHGAVSRATLIYGIASLVWLVGVAALVMAASWQVMPRLEAAAPTPVVWTGLGALYILLLMPVVVHLGRPLIGRHRARREGSVAPT